MGFPGGKVVNADDSATEYEEASRRKEQEDSRRRTLRMSRCLERRMFRIARRGNGLLDLPRLSYYC